jgi:predicted nucleic acid-binding protein
MVLVDTSVWIAHLRVGNARLRSMLLAGSVLAHPFVIGEVACGSLRARTLVLSSLAALPEAVVATHGEALKLLADERLFGSGLGWVDVHLLASARLSGALLWTVDSALVAAAVSLGVACEADDVP